MKIIATDDCPLAREGLRTLLGRMDEPVAFVEADSGAEALMRTRQHPDADLLLFDYDLPDMTGIEFLEAVAAKNLALPVVVLAAEGDVDLVRACLDAGAASFLPKRSLVRMLIPVVNLVLAGGVYAPPEVLGVATRSGTDHRGKGGVPRPALHALPPPPLTQRQRAVLSGLMRGLSNKEICRELDVVEATVKVHLHAIFKALGARSRTEAVIKAGRLNLL